jgi:hypothetical protein
MRESFKTLSTSSDVQHGNDTYCLYAGRYEYVAVETIL